MSKILMYGTPTCGDCVLAKQVFAEKNIDYDLVNDSSLIRYVIRDENEELVRHKNMSFFPTKEDAEKVLAEIVYKRFEEAAQ